MVQARQESLTQGDPATLRAPRTMYISYFGALKHLCQTQVIPYLKELSAAGIEVTLVSFEERLDDAEIERRERDRLARDLSAAGIDWRPLRYHKRPSLLAKAFDVAVGTIFASYVCWRKDINIVHARNHIPALMALAIKKALPVRILFDMRGVMAEEYVDAGLWKQGGIPYRITKAVERAIFRKADGIIMLTRRIEKVLREQSVELRESQAPIEIIPCCVELEKYQPRDRMQERERLGVRGTVMVYAGSLGGWYMTEEMARLFAAGRAVLPDLHFLVLTQTSPVPMQEALYKAGVPPESYTITTVASDAMPAALAAADFGVSLIKPCFSKISSSPTKIGEYLASGLPVLSSAGIGDIDELLSMERAGVLIERFDEDGYRAAVTRMAELLRDRDDIVRRCREAAERNFSMATVGRPGYLRAYRHLGAEVAS